MNAWDFLHRNSEGIWFLLIIVLCIVFGGCECGGEHGCAVRCGRLQYSTKDAR